MNFQSKGSDAVFVPTRVKRLAVACLKFWGFFWFFLLFFLSFEEITSLLLRLCTDGVSFC